MAPLVRLLAANLFLFFFLGLQVLLGFSLDTSYTEWVDNEMKSEAKDNPTTQERLLAKARRGALLGMLAWGLVLFGQTGASAAEQESWDAIFMAGSLFTSGTRSDAAT